VEGYTVTRVAAAVLLLALLGVLMVLGCGDSPPKAPSTTEIAAPDKEEGTVKEAKEAEFWRSWMSNIEAHSRQRPAKPK